MFQQAAELIQAEHRMRKSMWGQFWSAHQRFFKYLCISSKVNHCVDIAREAVRFGKVSGSGVLIIVWAIMIPLFSGRFREGP